jgi:predicted ATPase
MKLASVFARFYKSFNFDQGRAAHDKAKALPWEETSRGWYPYVEIGIHERITTIVGANESGKSHLLNAIEIAISGEGFRRQDLCRYSDVFNVEAGNDFWPHLGVSWTELGDSEVERLKAEASEAPDGVTRFCMFREGPDKLDLYFPLADGGYSKQTLTGKACRSFGKTWLPKPFRIRSNVALPRALPVSEIAGAGEGAAFTRAQRSGLIKVGLTMLQHWTGNAEVLSQALPGLAPTLATGLSQVASLNTEANDGQRLSYDLARRLLVKLAKVEPQRLAELADYLEQGEDGHAAALANSINLQLEKELNFPKFWVQDRDFQLLVTPHDTELTFTIRDRTGTQYTFDERSAGLQYFLSYFIQSQTHEPDPQRPEILLMDEPDAYLSAEAQQDLLKIFAEFAHPADGIRPIQVVYVTHSPFLLDKNHADRIRVLQKGKGADGTRVIRNASQNHYEPLRSAIGAYVGETAFIGACNLLVEGVADQVLLAGMSRLIQAGGPVAQGEVLDLNQIVIVPCGSAGHIPYMLYLIRGRDAEIPPVIVLLDSDKSGTDALKVLSKNDMRKLIKLEYVIAIDPSKLGVRVKHLVQEPEDLIPAGLAAAAAARYFVEISVFREEVAPVFTEAAVSSKLNAKCGVWEALKAIADETGHHMDKVGFVRALLYVCENPPATLPATLRADVETLKTRMKALFVLLNERRRKAELERSMERSSSKIERHRKIFLRERAQGATKEQAILLLEKIDMDLDQSLDADAVRNRMIAIKRRFDLDGGPLDPVLDYEAFLAALTGLKDAFALSEPPTAPEQTGVPTPTPPGRQRTRPHA